MRTSKALLLGLIAAVILINRAEAFEVMPERDWSFTIHGYQFGYVEWPRDSPDGNLGNYSNSKPFELHFGIWGADFANRTIPVSAGILLVLGLISGLTFALRRRSSRL